MDPLAEGLFPEMARLVQRFPSGALLACSGGGDSRALLDLMVQWTAQTDWSWAVATFDHGLRPESAAEADWVARQCHAYGVSHYLLHPSHSLKNHSGNLADNARSARYQALARCADNLGFRVVLTAHHLDDRVEGMLMALLRGGSPQALIPQPPLRPLGDELWLARPLNGTGRAELRAYLERHRLPWLEDRSNTSDRSGRGAVRHRWLPELERGHPGAREGMAASLSMLSQQLQRDERASIPPKRWHWWRRDPAVSPRQSLPGLGLGAVLSSREEREILTRWDRVEGQWKKPGLTLLWHGDWAGWGRDGLRPWQTGVWSAEQQVFDLGDWGYLWRDVNRLDAPPPHPFWGRLIRLPDVPFQVETAPRQQPWPAGHAKTVGHHLQGRLIPHWMRSGFPALSPFEGEMLWGLPAVAADRSLDLSNGARVGWCPPWWRMVDC